MANCIMKNIADGFRRKIRGIVFRTEKEAIDVAKKIISAMREWE